jgi:putative peptide zinc metalloprotease protein
MDGRRTVEKLWELTNLHLGEDAPTQDDVIHLLGQLHAADLLQSDVTPDSAEAFDRGERHHQAQRRRSWMNPLAIRIHLWDANRFLDHIAPLIRVLWSRWGGLLWLAVVLPALLLVPLHWAELSNNFSDRVLAVDNLLLLWLVFPVIKALHELGHAIATKRGGGEVHDMGVLLLVLIPVPYVEASAATVFKSKYERALVGAAGMVVELFIAALAFYLWLVVEPGLVRALLFNTMLVAGVSTLVFNGNPLLRYDAYYILADLIEMPNLAQRSARWWGWLIERYAFGAKDAEPPNASTAEKAWLTFYGFASTVYRVIVTATIALFVAGQFFFIGVLLALWAVVSMALLPLGKTLKHLGSPSLAAHRRRAVGVTVLFFAGLLALLFVVPAPFRSTAEGVVWLPERSMVRAAQDGFVERLVATPGAAVRQGELLFEMHDPALAALVRQAEARVAELEAAYGAQLALDRAAAGVVLEQLQRDRQVLAIVQQRAAGLQVRAAQGGRFVVPHAADLPGRRVRNGELLGYTIDDAEPPLARVVVPQESVDLVRRATQAVAVRLAHRPDETGQAQLVREVPQGEPYLPSRALATEGGGQIATDPRDPKGGRTMERTFQFDIALPQTGTPTWFGERVQVRFTHPMEPLGWQWLRAARRLFLSHFQL